MILEQEADVVAAHDHLAQHYKRALAWYRSPSRWLVRFGAAECAFDAPSTVYEGATPRLRAIAEMLNGYVTSARVTVAQRAKNDRAPMPPPSLAQLLDTRLQWPLGEAVAKVVYQLWEGARRSPASFGKGMYYAPEWPDSPVIERVLIALSNYLEQYPGWPMSNNPPTVAEILSDVC